MPKTKILDHGFITPQIIQGNHYVLGGYTKLKGDDINLKGDWSPFLSPPEWQEKDNIETQNCSGFGTFNAVESLEYMLTGVQVNHSDRALGIAAGTDPNGGNDPHVVVETIRTKTIVVDEAVLPFGPDIKAAEDYYKPKPLPTDVLAKGQKWADTYDLGHEWVFTGGTPADKKARLQAALKKGPVAVSVYAWVFDDAKGFYVKDVGQQDNHWVQLAYYNAAGNPVVYDSYGDSEDSDNPFLKVLDPLFDFGFAKVYYLNPAEKKRTILAAILLILAKIINLDALLVNQKLKPQPPIVPIEPDVPPPAPTTPPASKYLWVLPADVKHSVRVICDEEGLSVADKNILDACVHQESQYDTKVISKPNKNGTRDYGLCQFNDGKNAAGKAYWIGAGAAFATTDEVLSNPEKCVRIMAREFKRGEAGKREWVSYASGAYKKYL